MKRRILWLLFTVGFLGGALGRCALQPVHAATFDGTSYQEVPCSGDTAQDMTWTLRARVRTTAAPNPTGRAAFVEASSTSSSSYSYLGLGPAMEAECSARTGSTQAFARGVGSLADGQLHTIHCVADGSMLAVYVDGDPVRVAPLAAITASGRAMCTVGALRRPSGITNYWNGDVEDVETWDRALTAAEVAADVEDIPPPVVENCHGHTGLKWDAYTDARVTHFVVERQVQGTPESWTQAGDTTFCNREEWSDEEGGHWPAIRCETWPLLMAGTIPRENIVYEYRVRAVLPDGQRSVPSNVMTCGAQDPTRCYHAGTLEPCP